MPKLILKMEIKNWDIFKKKFVLGDNTSREKVGIKKIFIGHEQCNLNKVNAIFDLPHSNSMKEYVNNPDVKKMLQDSGIKLETLDGVLCED